MPEPTPRSVPPGRPPSPGSEHRAPHGRRRSSCGERATTASACSRRSPGSREEVELAEAKKWRATRYDAGFGWITGPRSTARESSPGLRPLYANLEARFKTPTRPTWIGLGMVAPTILAHATGEEGGLLPGHVPGDIVGCQLFSEPGAGSDLASLQTRAERDGDEWVISGQKVWTSGAQYSDIGEMIARTDPDQPKHKASPASSST